MLIKYTKQRLQSLILTLIQGIKKGCKFNFLHKQMFEKKKTPLYLFE